MWILKIGLCAVVMFMLAGCATPKPFDYTNYRQHCPRSILVLTPVNESTAVEATYGYLSTVTRPLAERGYYVYPVAVVDQLFKANGMPSGNEMQQVSLKKIEEIIGADAVLYITVKEYGTRYIVLSSMTTVRAEAKLVDVKSGMVLWEGVGFAQADSGGSGLLEKAITALVAQVVNSSTDYAHGVAYSANAFLVAKGSTQFRQNTPMLVGPYHPDFGKPTP